MDNGEIKDFDTRLAELERLATVANTLPATFLEACRPDLILELIARVPRWIPVSEPPKPLTQVLVELPYGRMTIDHVAYVKENGEAVWYHHTPLRWMSLPPAGGEK